MFECCFIRQKIKMWSVRKEIKWNRYWLRVALWEYKYIETKSGRKLLMEKCICDCWTIRFVQRNHLIDWSSKCCGCIWDQKIKEIWKTNTIHWMEWSVPYKKYMSAKARCLNKKSDSYSRYGWRWIKFERKNFAEFRKDMWKSYQEHVDQYWEKETTLERIDVNWNYCKENCKWATWDEQRNNMTTNHKVIYKWTEYPSISRLCRIYDLKYWLIIDRLRNWRTVEKAVETPLSQK